MSSRVITQKLVGLRTKGVYVSVLLHNLSVMFNREGSQTESHTHTHTHIHPLAPQQRRMLLLFIITEALNPNVLHCKKSILLMQTVILKYL